MRQIVRSAAARRAPSHRRLLILRVAPLARLLIGIAGIAIIVPILVEPTFENVVALVAVLSLALAFALKDYASCLAAGVVTILENTYQPGDWIELDGTYGEVKTIGTRAVHIVTADDTEVIIPHSRLWSTSVFNASSGNRSLLCVTNFYLQADHDGVAVRQALIEIGEASGFRKPESPVTVVATGTAVGHALQDQGIRYRQPRAVCHDHRHDDPRQRAPPRHGHRLRPGALCQNPDPAERGPEA